MISKKKKSSVKNRKPWVAILVIVVILIFVVAYVWIKLQNKTTVSNVAMASLPSQKVFYPQLYSSTHITQNAIATDPQFKNVTLVPEDSLLSNVISAVLTNTYAPKPSGKEKSTWLWTPLLTITPKYRTEIISGAKKNGITTIYLSIDSYLDVFVMQDGPEKVTKKKDFTTALQNFIAEAGQNNIAVVAEGGWQNWAEDGNSYKALAVLGYAMQFNKTHDQKLLGFQYDVEPYLLPEYQKNKKTVLQNFVSLIDQSVTVLNKSDLQLSVVIPDFYDSASGETPEFSYKGQSGYVFDHLLSVMERRQGSEIIVMSYRNFSKGDDGSIDISAGEITKANTSHSKIIVAQETGDVQPPYVTFFNTTRPYFNKQLALISSAFSGDKSFGGVAVHYVNAFLDLK